MPDLQFQIESAEAVPYATVPMLALKLSIANGVDHEPVHTLALRCQASV